jgi:hypothetical protein
MPKFDTIKEGDTYYDVRKERWHGTGWWSVKIISIDREKRTAQASWNGNPPRTYFERNIEKLRRSTPKSRE